MQLTDLALLDYLHDAAVDTITYDVKDNGDRVVRIRAHVHPDCGYEPWNGRTLTVVMRRAVLFTSKLLGYTAGGDTISTFGEGVSSETERELERFRAHGLGVPAIKLGLSFSSGSEMDIVCASVDVEVEATDLGERRMSCPPRIAAVLLEIMQRSILRIRSSASHDGCFAEADHIHNLPSLIADYREELLAHYLNCFTRDELLGYEPLWQELRTLLHSPR